MNNNSTETSTDLSSSLPHQLSQLYQSQQRLHHQHHHHSIRDNSNISTSDSSSSCSSSGGASVINTNHGDNIFSNHNNHNQNQEQEHLLNQSQNHNLHDHRQHHHQHYHLHDHAHNNPFHILRSHHEWRKSKSAYNGNNSSIDNNNLNYQSERLSIESDGSPPHSLIDLSAKIVAEHISFKSIEAKLQRMPESVQRRIIYWSHFPRHVDRIKMYSCPSSDTFNTNNNNNGPQTNIINIKNNNNINSSNNNNNNKKNRVGYWWSEKKSQKLNANELKALFAQRQCELVKIDLDRPLDEQGPFSLIVHKISDILVKADLGDTIAKKTISTFESYVRKHPELVIMDPLDNNRALLDRYKQYRLIEQSGLAKEGVVFTPPFVHLTSTNIDVNRGRIRRSKITFPLVCKPILAQGSSGAHQMCIIFNEAGLKDVKPPCVAQSFVNHNAKLFKLFVIKDKYYIMERPSLKNFQPGDQETVFFYSHDISKPNSSSSLTELDESDKLKLQDLMSKMKNLNINSSNSSQLDDDDTDEGFGHSLPTSSEDKTNFENKYPNDHHYKIGTSSILTNNNSVQTRQEHLIRENQYNECRDNGTINSSNNNNNRIDCSRTNICHLNDHKCSPLVPCNERLDKIVNIFSEKLGLTFYGIDIIIENNSSRYAIIDMNTFPGYDGVENFLVMFRDVVCDAIPKDLSHQSQLSQTETNRRKPTEIDSGIEST